MNMTHQIPRLTALLGGLVLVLGAALGGCESSPTEPAQILTDGRCSSTLPGQIVCEDATVQIGGDRIDVDVIRWVVRLPTGAKAASSNGVIGGDVTFTGLVRENYTIEQTPFLSNGVPGPLKVHSVTVF